MKNLEKVMKETWDTLAKKNAMYYIATERTDWKLDEFLESGKIAVQQLFEAVGYCPNLTNSVIELGCGIGRMSFALARLFREVIAVDVSEEMIAQANKLKNQLGCWNVRFIRNNGRDLSFLPSSSCDLGISVLVFQHLPDHRLIIDYIHELGRVVKSGGHVLFQVPIYEDSFWANVWRCLHRFLRRVIWFAQRIKLVSPERGIAFRGSRLSYTELKQALEDTNLKLLTIQRLPSAYRFCYSAIVYCRRL
ncbi:MAG: class I SAM-dependent methyltransferase [Candidatus Bathyarchaeia archaeon]